MGVGATVGTQPSFSIGGDIAAASRRYVDPDRRRAIAWSIYNNLPTDTLLWERADDFVPIDAARVAAALSA